MKLFFVFVFLLLAGCSSMRSLNAETCEAFSAVFCPLLEVSDGDASRNVP